MRLNFFNADARGSVSLDDVNANLEALARGDIVGRTVITFN